MQVILVQDVPHVGSLGDEVHVKDGYARNFLLPRGMAIAATTRNSRQIETRRKQLDKLRQSAIERAQEESQTVSALELVVRAKAGANGKLFGSVTNRDLQAVLAERGYTLDRRSIILHVPIKTLGTFGATVRLHTAVKTDISVRVEPEQDGEIPEGGEQGEGELAAEGEGAGETGTEASIAEGAGGAEQAEAAPAADSDAGGETPPDPATSPEAAPATDGEEDKADG